MDYIYIKCPLCGANDYLLRFPATLPGWNSTSSAEDINPDHFRCTNHNLGQHGDIVQCRQCQLIYNNPQPDPDSLFDVYKKVEDPLYLKEAAARERTFERSLDQLHRFIEFRGKLLDIGCYNGLFMKLATSAGWMTEGIELSTWAADQARKLGIGNIYKKPLELLKLPKNNFNAITMWDVIEHLSNPGAMLINVHSLLKPGGILAFSTHMVDSWAARLLGTRYPFFMEMHMVHFSKTTITRLLHKQGFQVLKIQPHPRILRVGYFLEKLSHKVKFSPVHLFLKWIKNNKRFSDKFIRVGFLGLVNIFAKKMD